MKFGINMLLWTSHVTEDHAGLFRDLKKAGYDGIEVSMFEGTPDHYARIGALLDKEGLGRTACSAIGGTGMNPLSADAAARSAAGGYAKWAIDCTAALGAEVLSGPMHSTIGHFSGAAPTAAERKRAISFHRKAGDHAAKKNVTLAVEALNRFECYLFNTMGQLSDYLDEVDHPHIEGMYDTFHANIEEKDPVAAIKTIKRHLIHVHISENDRGTPGKGHVPWAATYKALRAAKYDGFLTIEAFGRALPGIAAATKVWRDFFPSEESVYKLGIKQVRAGWGKAG